MQGTQHIERQIIRSDDTGHYLVQFAPLPERRQSGRGRGRDIRRCHRADPGGGPAATDACGVAAPDAQPARRGPGPSPRQTLGKGDALDAFRARLSALGRVQGLISNAEADNIDPAGADPTGAESPCRARRQPGTRSDHHDRCRRDAPDEPAFRRWHLRCTNSRPMQ